METLQEATAAKLSGELASAIIRGGRITWWDGEIFNLSTRDTIAATHIWLGAADRSGVARVFIRLSEKSETHEIKYYSFVFGSGTTATTVTEITKDKYVRRSQSLDENLLPLAVKLPDSIISSFMYDVDGESGKFGGPKEREKKDRT